MEDDTRLLRFYVGLTPRQREVLQLVSMGMSNREAAARLFVAPSVVAGHLTNIYGEIACVEGLPVAQPNRYVVVRLFGDFFERYPELDNFVG